MYISNEEQKLISDAYRCYNEVSQYYTICFNYIYLNKPELIKKNYELINDNWNEINAIYQILYSISYNTHILNMVRDIKATIQYMKVEIQEELKKWK